MASMKTTTTITTNTTLSLPPFVPRRDFGGNATFTLLVSLLDYCDPQFIN